MVVVTPKQALAFVKENGVVLESAGGAVPSLAEAIAGKAIRGRAGASVAENLPPTSPRRDRRRARESTLRIGRRCVSNEFL